MIVSAGRRPGIGPARAGKAHHDRERPCRGRRESDTTTGRRSGLERRDGLFGLGHPRRFPLDEFYAAGRATGKTAARVEDVDVSVLLDGRARAGAVPTSTVP